MNVNELQLIHSWLVKKLSSLPDAKDPNEYSETNLTKGILTFIKTLMEKEISSQVFSSNPSFGQYTYAPTITTTGPLPDISNVPCHYCQLMNPKPSVCIHKVMS